MLGTSAVIRSVPTVHEVVSYAISTLEDGWFVESLTDSTGIRYMRISTKSMSRDQKLEVVIELVDQKVISKVEGIKLLLALWANGIKGDRYVRA